MSLLSSTRIYTPIILGVSLIVGGLFLKPIYTSTIEHGAVLSQKKQELASKEKAYADLMMIKNKTNSGSTDEVKAKVKKLGKKFDTSDIMQIVMLNDFTRSSLGQSSAIRISTISVNKGSKLPSGLSLGSVSVGVSAQSVDDLIRYITYLTTQTDYVFAIDSISLPIDTAPEDPSQSVGGYSMGLSLSMYYYE